MNDYISYLKRNGNKFSKFLDYLLNSNKHKFSSDEQFAGFREVIWGYKEHLYNLHLMHPTYTSGVSQFTKQLELSNKLFTYCDRFYMLGDTIPSVETTKWSKALQESLDDFFDKDLENVIPAEEKTYYSRLAMDKDADLSHHLSHRYNALKSQENPISKYLNKNTGLG